ncbi:MAG: hypothetical protein N4A45_07130 [Flavobacteriales bacterium]|jgi:hypothetical protein|nr:hypothetical protein [Flavobacteriales bacterium]
MMRQTRIQLELKNQQKLENLLYDIVKNHTEKDFAKNISQYRQIGEMTHFVLTFETDPNFEELITLLHTFRNNKKPLELGSIRAYYWQRKSPKLETVEEFMLFYEHEIEFGLGLKMIDKENNCFALSRSGSRKHSSTNTVFETHIIPMNQLNHLIDILSEIEEDSKLTNKWWKFWGEN